MEQRYDWYEIYCVIMIVSLFIISLCFCQTHQWYFPPPLYITSELTAYNNLNLSRPVSDFLSLNLIHHNHPIHVVHLIQQQQQQKQQQQQQKQHLQH